MEITKHSEAFAHLTEPEGSLSRNVMLVLLWLFTHYANAVSFGADVCSLQCLLN